MSTHSETMQHSFFPECVLLKNDHFENPALNIDNLILKDIWTVGNQIHYTVWDGRLAFIMGLRQYNPLFCKYNFFHI